MVGGHNNIQVSTGFGSHLTLDKADSSFNRLCYKNEENVFK